GILDPDPLTVWGQPIGQCIETADDFPQTVIRAVSNPIYPAEGLKMLHGNLAPNGAVIKPVAASAALLQHEGRAIVFNGLEDLAFRIDDPELDVRADDVLVLRGIGPIAAGMPEAGLIPIPKKLAAQGVKDMVRISDGRMSGTAFGTIVLHISPEAAAGGPLARVRDGDRIRLDVKAGTIDVLVEPSQWSAREPASLPTLPAERGFGWLHSSQVTQAESGCDFRFLQGPSASPVSP
ncbi:MAG: dihydroxy-acid dehydratase, partial [Betaproteobacteria bacterium]|nr:dihydroxy-acid dehydratase [Betaproteobacteria bacterium]